ncbi:MAG TPA: CoA transferase, partial [Ramlibacter sp.]|nr:CoA transferase [Ramlibacter sp.]
NYPDHIPNPTHAAFALLAALRHRRRTGQGQYIDFAQVEPTVALLGPTILDLTANGRVQQRQGNRHPSMAPHGVYPCLGEDKWIAIAVRDDAGWRQLCAVLGNSGWATDSRWDSTQGRLAGAAELDGLIAQGTAQRDGRQLMTELQALGVAAGVVQTAEDIVKSDPQLAHRGHWLALDHAEMGRALYNAPPFRFAHVPVGLRGPAPLLGEHTREVLGELLGVGDAEYDELLAAEVLQ